MVECSSIQHNESVRNTLIDYYDNNVTFYDA